MFNDLKTALTRRDRRRLTRPKDAAVLVPIIDDGGPLRLLLTRRTETLSTHKGHVAFPGGRIDPEDDGPTAAALREATEEIHLPSDAVEILGWLDDFPTIHNDTSVTPVVGILRSVPDLVAEPHEVARIFTIPFDVLTSPEGWRTRDGQSWPMIYCDYDGETLWGLTAYITMHLIEQIDAWKAPHSIPNHLIR